MTKTRLDIITRALKVLGVVGTGQSPSPEDAELIDIDAVAAQLLAEGYTDLIGPVANGELPNEWFLPFSHLVAANHGILFGNSMTEMAALEADSLNKIRKIEDCLKPVKYLKIGRIGI